MDETSIGGYDVLDELAMSKRFRSFRASRRAPEGQRQGTLYLMTEELGHPELFIETVDAIRAAWPFAVAANRDVVLPEVQLWTGRPWFFLPDSLPVAASVRIAGRAAFAALTAQLRWLQQFQPPGGEGEFAHGDVRKERIAVFDAEQPLLIAPGWVAASDYARGADLSHVRGDDTWHLGKLWIKDSDHSFVPEGMEPDPTEAARRLPRAVLPARSGEREAQGTPVPAAAHPAAAAADKVAAARPKVAAATPAPAPARASSAAVPARTPAPARATAPARTTSGPFASPARAPAQTPGALPARAARPNPFAAPVGASASTPAAPAARAVATSAPAPAARVAAVQAVPAERPAVAAEAPVAVTVPAPKARARPVTRPEVFASPPALPDEVITSAPPLPAKVRPAPAVATVEPPRPIAELALDEAASADVAPLEAVAPLAAPPATSLPAPSPAAGSSAPLAAPLAPAERKGKGAVILALVVLILLLLAAALFLRSKS